MAPIIHSYRLSQLLDLGSALRDFEPPTVAGIGRGFCLRNGGCVSISSSCRYSQLGNLRLPTVESICQLFGDRLLRIISQARLSPQHASGVRRAPSLAHLLCLSEAGDFGLSPKRNIWQAKVVF